MTSVIIIDDDRDIVETMSEILEIYGMKVVGKGYNGKEAVELFQKLKPNLTILDFKMPEFDGLYALKQIRKIDSVANVIIVSGDIPETVTKEIQQAKPTKIFTKPIDVKVIVELFSSNPSEEVSYEIKYKFKDSEKTYTCTMTSEQLTNFKELPSVDMCIVMKENRITQEKIREMERALKLAIKKDISKIILLSESSN